MMATLSIQKLDLAGLSPTFSNASSGGDEASTGDRRALLVRNSSSSSVTVTMTTPGTVGGIDIADPTVEVGADAMAVVPLATVYKASNGRAAIGYSSASSVTVAVVELP